MTQERRLPVLLAALAVGGVGIGSVIFIEGHRPVTIAPAPAGYSAGTPYSGPPEPDCANPQKGHVKYCAAVNAGGTRCRAWRLPPTAASDGFRTMAPGQRRAYIHSHGTPVNCVQDPPTAVPAAGSTGPPTAAPTSSPTPSEIPHG